MKKAYICNVRSSIQKSFWLRLFSILFFGLTTANAQYQLPVYTDYLTDNYYLLHPAMAGAHFEGAKIRLTHRSQWQGVQNAPSLQTLNGHTRLGRRTGLGAAFYRDQNGFQSRVGGLLTYSYHINFFRSNVEINQLSFGLSIGGVNNTHDQSTFDPFLGDPLLTGTKVNSSSLHMDMGFSYNRLGMYAHMTIKNLFFRGNNISDAVALEKPRSVLLNAGYFVELSPKWALEPSFMLQGVQYADIPSYDLNLKSHHHRRNLNAWWGLSYRAGLDTNAYLNAGSAFDQKHQQLTTLVGAEFGIFSFSYSYTQSLEKVNFRPLNSHQLTLGIDITSEKFRIYPIRGLL
ncbi:MAG: PorP/SprF family type IX secretion system membrane protein [Flavobacteriaceae bacterium]